MVGSYGVFGWVFVLLSLGFLGAGANGKELVPILSGAQLGGSWGWFDKEANQPGVIQTKKTAHRGKKEENTMCSLTLLFFAGLLKVKPLVV